MKLKGILLIVAIAVAGLCLGLVYRKGGNDTERKMAIKSAVVAADASKKVLAEARRAANETSSYSADTPVDVGNSLLFGEGSGQPRKNSSK